MMNERTELKLASTLRCWAANIEDVSLRWHGHPEDLQVLMESAEDMLDLANELDDPPVSRSRMHGRKLVHQGIDHYLDAAMTNTLLDAGLIHRPVPHMIDTYTIVYPHTLYEVWETLYGKADPS